MYDYAHAEDFYLDEKEIVYMIAVASTLGGNAEDEVWIGNSDIEEDSFEFIDSINDEEVFTFKKCISAYIKFITNITTRWIGEALIVYEILNNDFDNPIPIGTFIVQSDNLTSDRKTREIIAYDFMFEIINSDATDWYNSLSFPISIKNFRDSFFNEYGIEQETVDLINDDIIIPRQLSEEEHIDGATVVQCLSELNGEFIHGSKRATVKYISIDRGNIHDVGLYPGFYPGLRTFPGIKYQGGLEDIFRNYYKEESLIWANYTTRQPDGIQIRNQDNTGIAYQNNEGALNPYVITENFLLRDLSAGQYKIIGDRLYDKIKELTFTPFSAELMGNPCVEVGDRVRIFTFSNEEIVSYVFSKHTTGISVPWDTVEANGEYYFSKYDIAKPNTLKEKVNKLEQRTGNLEKSGSGPLQIVSVAELPENPSLNVLYLIQGEVTRVT